MYKSEHFNIYINENAYLVTNIIQRQHTDDKAYAGTNIESPQYIDTTLNTYISTVFLISVFGHFSV